MADESAKPKKAETKKAVGKSAAKRSAGGDASAEGLLPVTILACAGPVALHVVRVIIDQEATTEAMLGLFIVAAFGLTALVGQRWAARLAPYVFLLSAGPLVIQAVMGLAPGYWVVLLGLSWCIHELVVAGDIKENLARRAAAN